MDEQDQRDQLSDRAKYGEITGDEADAEAIRLGLGSLSRRPGPEEFRPEALTHWTLPMAVAWIAFLDLDEVREWSAPYRADCREWLWQRWRVGFEGPIHEGWHLEARSKPTLALLGLSATYDNVAKGKPLSMSIDEAREALWIALREGFFPATGIDTETGRRVEIPALEWRELVPVQTKGDADEVRRGLLGHGYRDVLFPVAPLRGHWRKIEPPTYTLPPIMPPTGFGYMPLFCAAQWIATEGGRSDFDPIEVNVWRTAYAQLVDAISSGAVKVVGVQGHQTLPVPAYLFVGIRVDYPYADRTIDMILSNELVLRCYPYVDEEHWRNGFDDALVDRGGDRWVRLSVEKSGVRTAWPFDDAPAKSGTPGRPTSAHLFKAEMERRAARGDLCPTLAAETRYLSKWLEDNHPTMPQALPGSIAEVIRTRYWKLHSQN
jgi:hypothetical protein